MEQRGLHVRKHNEVEALTNAFITLENEFEFDKTQRKQATNRDTEATKLNEN